jgi:hypothetical protein
MARRGDAIHLRGRTWWLDFTHRSERHVLRLGRGITKTVARELASVQRGAILRGEAGIGGPKTGPPTPALRGYVATWLLSWIFPSPTGGTLRVQTVSKRFRRLRGQARIAAHHRLYHLATPTRATR